jgi:hypothetical protein
LITVDSPSNLQFLAVLHFLVNFTESHERVVFSSERCKRLTRASLETLASSQSGYSGRIRKRGTSKRVEWTAVAGDAGVDSGRGTQAARDGD